MYARDLTAGVIERPRVSAHLPLDETFALWLADLEKTHDRETCITYTGYAKRFVAHFGSLANITRARMGDYQRERLTRVLATSVRKERSAMNTFLDWCVEQGVLHEDSTPEWPTLSKRTLGVRSGHQRAAPVDVTPEQVNAFLAALPAWSKPLKGYSHAIRARFVVMYETGLRPALLDELSVPEHWRPGQAFIRIADEIDKARYGRKVPITPRALRALDETWAVLRKDSGLVFGAHSYRWAVERARVVSGLPEDFAPYDLRHGRGGHLLDETSDMRGVAFLLGHKQLTTTNRYLRGQEENAQAVIDAMGSGDDPGIGGLPMMGAKEGSRTPTPVKALEPESVDLSRADKSYDGLEGQEGSQSDSFGQGFGDTPESIQRSARYLSVLRAEWDAYDALGTEDES